ncbi:uncharacterized protein TNCV_3782931 [Trichonephila clavipes]|nr:uncharacterized protein TNCV_3782931 [Trichonephila clavipes]
MGTQVIRVQHRMGASPGVQNVVADVLSRNSVGNMDGSQISCAALLALALNSREHLTLELREDPELGHIYRYSEYPDDGSINATVCEGWSHYFKLIDGLLFYANYSSTLGELTVYIPKSFREAIMQEFHDLPLADHLGKRKTYLKLRDTCYFPYMRKYIFEYVSTWDRCQKFNFKNALPAGRLILIVSNYPNGIVGEWSESLCLSLKGHIECWKFEITILSFGKREKRVTVNIDEVREYYARQSETISFDSHDELLYEGQRSSIGSSRSHPGISKRSRKSSSEESKGRKSNKGNAGLEDPGLKRKVRSNGSVERIDKNRSKICKKRSLQGFDYGDQKRPTPVPTQGIKRALPSSIPSRKYKYRNPNNPSQGPQSIASPLHQLHTRQ